MADSPVTRIKNYFFKNFGITPEEIPIPKQIGEGVDLNKPLDVSTKSTFVPDKNNPMGKFRETETKLGKGSTGKSPYGLANTNSPEFKKFLKDEGLTGQQAFDFGDVKPKTDFPDKLQVNIREPLQTKNVTTKTIGPNPANYGIDEFDRYYADFKKTFPKFKDMQALENYATVRFQQKYPNYKKAPKLVSLIDEGVLPKTDDFLKDMETKTGVKTPSRYKTGIRAAVTEALKQNEGYVTKEVTEAIDDYIRQFVDSIPQKDFDKFAVELIGEVNPKTGKPYTPTEIKKALSNRAVYALGSFMDKKIKPAMLDELFKSMAGSMSFDNLEPIIERKMNKLRTKYIAPTVAALVGIVKSGNASQLLKAGSSELFGIPGEFIFASELGPDSETFTQKEQDEIDKARFIFGNNYAEQLKEQIENAKIKKEERFREEMGIGTL
tara:strand:- start:3286 stop:4596 length:1311 start_codon:yes stop_codon:yes gene_type:complete